MAEQEPKRRKISLACVECRERKRYADPETILSSGVEYPAGSVMEFDLRAADVLDGYHSLLVSIQTRR
jgi:hypothetical protein